MQVETQGFGMFTQDLTTSMKWSSYTTLNGYITLQDCNSIHNLVPFQINPHVLIRNTLEKTMENLSHDMLWLYM